MIVYDAGALIAAERGDGYFRGLHESALRDGLSPIVPAAVLAQVWRKGPQPRLSRALAGCDVVPLDEHRARITGVWCGESGTSDVVDASVVAVAAMHGAAVVTSDPEEIQALAASAGVNLVVHAV